MPTGSWSCEAGLVEQVGTPTELYEQSGKYFCRGIYWLPENELYTRPVTEAAVRQLTVSCPAFAGGTLTVATKRQHQVKTGGTVTVGMRPEHLELQSARPVLTMKADFAEYLGGASQIYAQPEGAPMITIVVPGRPAIARNDTLPIGIAQEHIYLFDSPGLGI